MILSQYIDFSIVIQRRRLVAGLILTTIASITMAILWNFMLENFAVLSKLIDALSIDPVFLIVFSLVYPFLLFFYVMTLLKERDIVQF